MHIKAAEGELWILFPKQLLHFEKKMLFAVQNNSHSSKMSKTSAFKETLEKHKLVVGVVTIWNIFRLITKVNKLWDKQSKWEENMC